MAKNAWAFYSVVYHRGFNQHGLPARVSHVDGPYQGKDDARKHIRSQPPHGRNMIATLVQVGPSYAASEHRPGTLTAYEV